MTRYFLAVTLCWLCFWGLYQLLLRRETFFRANRFYLLGTLLLGLLIPLLEWPQLPAPLPGRFEPLVVQLPELVVDAQTAASGPAWSWTNLITGLYILGCATALVRLLMSAHSLYTLQRQCRREERAGCTLLIHPSIQVPFSFGRQLFWDGGHAFDEREREAVLAHECAHIRHGHSLDILLLEGLRLAFWWCPLWYAYSRSLREVHEYQADAAVLQAIPKRNYGRLLIRQALQGPALRLAHGLKHSSLKHRIAMMTQQPSSLFSGWKYALVAPLVAGLIFACNSGEEELTEELAEPVRYEQVTQRDTLFVVDPETYETTRRTEEVSFYRLAEQMPVFGSCPGRSSDGLQTCSNRNLMQYVSSNLKYPESARAEEVEGRVIASFIIDKTGTVSNIEIKRSLSASCDAEVRRILGEMPDWQPGTIDGKPVNVQLHLPVRFQL